MDNRHDFIFSRKIVDNRHDFLFGTKIVENRHDFLFSRKIVDNHLIKVFYIVKIAGKSSKF